MRNKINILVFSIIFFNCTKKNETKYITKPLIKKETKKSKFKFTIEEAEYLSFRRNYNYDEKTYEDEKLRDKLDKRNPDNCFQQSKNTTKIKLAFNKLNLLDEYGCLKINVWKKISEKNIDKIIIDKKAYFISFDTEKKHESFDFIIKDEFNNICAKNIFEFGLHPDVSFYIYDVDNDGNDEIITMHQSYIVNGDNFDFCIYEIFKSTTY